MAYVVLSMLSWCSVRYWGQAPAGKARQSIVDLAHRTGKEFASAALAQRFMNLCSRYTDSLVNAHAKAILTLNTKTRCGSEMFLSPLCLPSGIHSWSAESKVKRKKSASAVCFFCLLSTVYRLWCDASLR